MWLSMKSRGEIIKLGKSSSCLLIKDMLKSREQNLNRKTLSVLLYVSERQISRYISEINTYLANTFSPLEVKYSKTDDTFKLVSR